MFFSKWFVANVSFVWWMNVIKTKDFVVAVAVRLYKLVTGKMDVKNADKQGIDLYDDMLEMATKVCRDYLQGPWKKITVNDISVKRISGGLSNWIYWITLLRTNIEHRDVLIRLYGQKYGENGIENIITESVIFTLLSERGLGPKLHGIFPGGRLEEYIPARSLKSKELSDSKLSLLIAERMADLHQLSIPINKDPIWLWDTMDRYLQQPIKNVNWSQYHIKLDNIKSMNLCEEACWLKKHLTKLESPVVFCHNDIQEGNILLKENESSGYRSLCLIDYEYCAYNYRGFDIANHFIEWTYDYTNPIYPHYTANQELFPTRDQQTEFLKQYFQCMGNDESMEIILHEVQHFILASHLLWGLWSIVNSHTSKITFGYKEYAEERLKSYFKLKDSLLNNKLHII